jgi:hypothetical protein
MLEAHITENQFLSMQEIDDLEWREYLTYNVICCYVHYRKPRGYDALEFEPCCLGLYALQYYYKLEIAFEDYYYHH